MEPGTSSIFVKMTKLADIMAACRDKALMDAFEKLPGGAKLYESFLTVINNEVNSLIMGDMPKAPDLTSPVTDLSATVYALQATIASLVNTVNSLMNSQLLGTLNILNEKMTGAVPAAQPQQYIQPPVPQMVTAPGVAPLPPANLPPVTMKYADGVSPVDKVRQFVQSAPVPQSPVGGLF